MHLTGRIFGLAALLISCWLPFSLGSQEPSQKGSAGTAKTGQMRASCDDRYCAETSRQVKPASPINPPRVNEVFHDPEFGSRMVRVTDDTGIRGAFAGLSFVSNSSAEINEWGKFNPSLGQNGGYYFYALTSGGGAVAFSMDATTMQVKPHCGASPNCLLPSGGTFSYVDPNLIYGHFGSTSEIAVINLATGKQSRIYDLKKCPGLPGDLSGYPGAISNSGDDTKFSNYSGGKSQGWGSLVTFYDRSADRCYWYDTGSGMLGGSGMAPTAIKTGLLPPPAVPRLTAVAGTLPAGDYYVELTANTRKPSGDAESLPSPEANIRLDRDGGISVSAPQIENPYALPAKSYNVYIGTAPGQETRQESVEGVQQGYTQASALKKGANPPKASTAGYTVHNARLSRDGKVVKVAAQQGGTIYFWWPGTTNVVACSTHGESHSQEVASFCGGHTVMGYSHLINHGGPGANVSMLLRPLSDLSRFTQLIPSDPPISTTMDTHWSWNNADPADSTPVCGAFARGGSSLQGDGTRNPASNALLSIRQPWDSEIVCVATSG